MERLGISNALVLNEHPKKLTERFAWYFDKILVDAPCSGEGMFRKEEAAVTDWTEDTKRHLMPTGSWKFWPRRQACSAPAAVWFISTCTFSPVENEGVISEFLWKNPDFSVEKLDVPFFSPGRPDWVSTPAPGLEHTFRLWPHRLLGEGHYAAVLRRTGDERLRRFHRNPRPNARRNLRHSEARPGAALPEGKLLRFGDVCYLVPQELPEVKGLRVLRAGLELGAVLKNQL